MSELVLPEGVHFHADLEIKRSRFLANVSRAESPEAARALIAEQRARFPDARHHCTAFVVPSADSSPILHSSDDGEPSGTAGRPMLEALVGLGLTNTVAVISRYFGGTLLGTGGLVRAYSGAVKDAVEGAPVLIRSVVPVWSALLPHQDAGRYLAELSNCGFAAVPEYLADGAMIHVPTTRGKALASLLARLSSGIIQPTGSGEAQHEAPWGVIHHGVATRTADSSPS